MRLNCPVLHKNYIWLCQHEDKTMSDRYFYIAIYAFLITAWMMRWEIAPSSGTEGNSVGVYFKLDRFTGSSYFCAGYDCYKSETDND